MICLLSMNFFFYQRQNDPRFAIEQPWIFGVWIALSLGAVVLWYLIKPKELTYYLNLQRGVQIVILAWIIWACISAVVFVLAWFPDPINFSDYSLRQRFVDWIFESISGFTTAWGSILPSVEVFPRSILMWRSMTHFIGWMGIVYMTITILRSLWVNRSEVINAESEWPHIVRYDNDQEAISSGYNFFKVYFMLTCILIVLLTISGWLFRIIPYEKWYDIIFDAINYAFSTMGTGWFGTYDTSAWLWVVQNNIYIIKWLQNTVSEWIIAFFMIFAGMNFGLRYELFFQKNRKLFIRNKELQVFIWIIFVLTIGIVLDWKLDWTSFALFDLLRWAFFSVTSIISTTWLANYDFSLRPSSAIWLLLIAYFTWSCVWSTAWWVKILRLIVFVKYAWLQISNLVNDKPFHGINVDGVKYSVDASSIILLNIIIYFMLFLLWGVVLMEVNPIITLLDGTQIANNFTTSFGASIANLGNIWPTPTIDNINLGPSGNYAPLNSSAKLVLSILMLLGRVGVLSLLMLFMDYKAQQHIGHKIETVDYDEHNKEEVIHLRT